MITSIINTLNPWKKWRIAEKELMNYRQKLNNLTFYSKKNEFKDIPGLSKASDLSEYNLIGDYGAIPDFIRLKNEQISDIKNTLWSILFFGAINIVLLYTIPVLGIIVLVSNIISAALRFKQLYEQHKVVNSYKDRVNEYLNDAIEKVMDFKVDITLSVDAENALQANQIINYSLKNENKLRKIIGKSSNINEINQKIMQYNTYYGYEPYENVIISSINFDHIKELNDQIVAKETLNIHNNAVNKAIECKDSIDSYDHIINKIQTFINKIEQHPTFIEGHKSINKTNFEDMRLGDEKEMIFSNYVHSLDSCLPMAETKYEVATGRRPEILI